eukprot:1964235-Rhodomonas_salina.1
MARGYHMQGTERTHTLLVGIRSVLVSPSAGTDTTYIWLVGIRGLLVAPRAHILPLPPQT